ncbi:hypothetical protein GPJ56_004459 [Histomonas meleagridis]|uniref:uncharacterized protein n=1 Tax=Histomonas meleagridis TaxID=135588 RepID=UPI003559CE45|nr:hypothetical protein GPJ56_004459 [Histomonas meleagridis]KAH0802013.1 hypothetical protein GO595_005094 [Histomonas meleagridis]
MFLVFALLCANVSSQPVNIIEVISKLINGGYTVGEFFNATGLTNFQQCIENFTSIISPTFDVSSLVNIDSPLSLILPMFPDSITGTIDISLLQDALQPVMPGIFSVAYDIFGLMNWDLSLLGQLNATLSTYHFSLQQILESVNLDTVYISQVYPVLIKILKSSQTSWTEVYQALGGSSYVENYQSFYGSLLSLTSAYNDQNMSITNILMPVITGVNWVSDLIDLFNTTFLNVYDLVRGPLSKAADIENSPIAGRMHYLEDLAVTLYNNTHLVTLYNFLATFSININTTEIEFISNYYIIPIAQAFATGHPNIKSLLLGFGCNETEVNFALKLIEMCTSAEYNVIDAFSYYAQYSQNQTLIMISNALRMINQSLSTFSLSTNILSLLSLTSLFGNDIGPNIAAAICGTIYQITDRNASVFDYPIIQMISQLLNTTMINEDEFKDMLQMLTLPFFAQTPLINLLNVLNISPETIYVIYGLITQLQTQTVNEVIINNMNTTIEFGGQSFPLGSVIDMFIKSISTNIVFYTQSLQTFFERWYLDNLYQFISEKIINVFTLLQHDFTISQLLDPINPYLDEALFLLIPPLQRILMNGTINDVFSAIPNTFCDISATLTNISNAACLSLPNIIDCIVFLPSANVSIYHVLPLPYIYNVSLQLQSNAIQQSITLNDISAVGIEVPSNLVQSVNDISNFMSVPSKPFIVKAMTSVLPSQARALDPILGSINTAAISAYNGQEVDLTFPDNSVQYDYGDDFGGDEQQSGYSASDKRIFLSVGAIAGIACSAVVILAVIIVLIVFSAKKTKKESSQEP